MHRAGGMGHMGGGVRRGGMDGMMNNMGGMGDQEYVNDLNSKYQTINQSIKSSKGNVPFAFGTFFFVIIYEIALFFFMFGVILLRKRVQQYIRMPTILLYIFIYILNIGFLRGVFGYHYLYQVLTSAAMGLAIMKFRNLSVIGLTGGIGCGKSTLCVELKQKLGANVIDCDKIVHKLQEPGMKCYNDIVNVFGEDILDDGKKIDRAKLREMVFNDREQKRKLEKIMKIEIFKAIIFAIWDTFWSGLYHFAILDAPLLYEGKVLEWICYPIIVVYVSDKRVWVDRIMKRDNCTEKEAINKIQNQMPIEAKIAKAEIAIDNLGDPKDMVSQFGQKFMQYVTM